MRVLLHQNTAIYASFVSCSNLSLILLGNAVCVGHGGAATRRRFSELRRGRPREEKRLADSTNLHRCQPDEAETAI
jgi:hypothetical protein